MIVTNSRLFKGIVVCLFLMLPAGAATAQQPAASTTKQQKEFSYKLLTAPQSTWGYDIFSDGKLMIHQPSLPGMPGNAGFKTKKSAEKVAELVISKIKKGQMPPTVTIDEMKALKAI